METVAIDLHVSSNVQVSRVQEVAILVHILVPTALQELALHHA